MYKHGKPIYRFDRRAFAGIIITLVLIVGGALFITNRTSKDTFKNNTKPLISTVKASQNNTSINEPAFIVTLPGKWNLAAYNWDARYHAWQWETHDKLSAGRWFRIYQDTIPTDYAYNYMLPVSASADSLALGQMSGNCSDFTTTAGIRTSNGTYAAPSKWQQISFLCDYANNNQLVGTSSQDGMNSITLKGFSATHKFFFLYQDNNISPDFGIFNTILGTFKVK